MTSVRFPRVAILGLGLIGGSLGLALRTRGLAEVVAGYDVAPGVAQEALKRGAVDVACSSLAEAVAEASLVVLAAPILALRPLLAEIAPALAPGAVVTDVGSVKDPVVRWADELLPDSTRFLGGHPMAGSEHTGITAADAALFEGCVWCLTPSARTDAQAIERIDWMVRQLGAHPRRLHPLEHDRAVATISHLPLVAAAALALTAAEQPTWPLARELAAGGFRDTTRVASGEPRMARDICLTNTEALVDCLDTYLTTLSDLRARIAAGDGEIERVFVAAKRTRDGWLAKREGMDRDG